MNPNQNVPRQEDPSQRDALADAQKQANRQQPADYREAETEAKQVRIGPDVTDDPIHGIDPAGQDQGQRTGGAR